MFDTALLLTLALIIGVFTCHAADGASTSREPAGWYGDSKVPPKIREELSQFGPMSDEEMIEVWETPNYELDRIFNSDEAQAEAEPTENDRSQSKSGRHL